MVGGVDFVLRECGGLGGSVRSRLGADLGWVGWGRYGLLRYIARMGGVEC